MSTHGLAPIMLDKWNSTITAEHKIQPIMIDSGGQLEYHPVTIQLLRPQHQVIMIVASLCNSPLQHDFDIWNNNRGKQLQHRDTNNNNPYPENEACLDQIRYWCNNLVHTIGKQAECNIVVVLTFADKYRDYENKLLHIQIELAKEYPEWFQVDSKQCFAIGFGYDNLRDNLLQHIQYLVSQKCHNVVVPSSYQQALHDIRQQYNDMKTNQLFPCLSIHEVKALIQQSADDDIKTDPQLVDRIFRFAQNTNNIYIYRSDETVVLQPIEILSHLFNAFIVDTGHAPFIPYTGLSGVYSLDSIIACKKLLKLNSDDEVKKAMRFLCSTNLCFENYNEV
jgi:hypothetical protein